MRCSGCGQPEALALTSAAFFGVYAMNEAQVDELSDRTTERPAGYNALIYAQNRRAVTVLTAGAGL